MNSLAKVTPLILGIYGCISIAVYFFQAKILFYPDNTDMKSCSINSGFSYVEEDDIRYLESQENDFDSILILFHGNAGSACHRMFFQNFLANTKTKIILVEYPGYSADKQKLEQQKILDNALKAFDKISNLFQSKRVILMGESLGTGVATYVASKREVSHLFLHAPYTSILDLAKLHYFYLPVSLLLKFPFPAHEWALNVKSKVSIIHGENDQVIPAKIGKEQSLNFKNLENYQAISDVGHNDIWNQESITILRQFILNSK